MKGGVLFLNGKMVWDTPHASQPIRSTTKKKKRVKKLAALLLLFCTPLLFVSLQLCARAFSFPSLLSGARSFSSIPWFLDCGFHPRHQCWENRLEFFGALHGTNFQDCILVLSFLLSFFLSFLACSSILCLVECIPSCTGLADIIR
jgi:hypothetical protein